MNSIADATALWNSIGMQHCMLVASCALTAVVSRRIVTGNEFSKLELQFELENPTQTLVIPLPSSRALVRILELDMGPASAIAA